MEQNKARYAAMVEFLGTFPNVSKLPTHLKELNDGVALFEALSEIAPRHFDPATIARDLGENWALKSSNLRKLLRNLDQYYRDVLGKKADFQSIIVTDISRNANCETIAALFELVAAAAITCDHRAEFVGRIMTMTSEGQVWMKNIIESSLIRLEDYRGSSSIQNEEEPTDQKKMDDGEKEMVFGEDVDYDDIEESFDASGSLWGSSGAAEDGEEHLLAAVRERDELRAELELSQTELAKVRSEMVSTSEEVESDNNRLRDLTDDLQNRLVKTQKALTAKEEETSKLKRQLEEATASAEQVKETNSLLADELDVANAKATQLRKAEATAVAYKQKLQSVGVLSQQMQELEDQSAEYIRQIMDLETANKQVPVLQKRLEAVQEEVRKIEMQNKEGAEAAKSKDAEISKLKRELEASVKASKMYEDELSELRAQNDNGDFRSNDDYGMADLSLTSAKSIKDSRERLVRLQHENEVLKKKLDVADDDSGGDAKVPGDLRRASSLRKQLKEKDEYIAKISSDKAKLEAYTKKTLAKFQQKYMVALQECKEKLKDKHDRIEQLEAEKESEKAAQKREAQLLSSTIYELGLAIMQNKLTQR